jgi:deoxyribonuclease V
VTDQPGRRFGAVDVHYPPAGGACAALAVAQDTRFGQIVGEYVAWLDTVDAYQPGRFYLRELPAINAVLATTNPLDLLIIDGYVDLDPHGRAGLGAHLYAEIKVPVIGVAKTAFRSATHAIAVQRGNATRPLFVTAIGLPATQAAELVTRMAGQHRIPDALRRVDTLARRRTSIGSDRESAPMQPRSSGTPYRKA